MGAPARIASFFKTKRDGMLVGSVREESLDLLIGKIKEAKAAKLGLVLFLFTNAGGKGPIAGMTVDVERPRESGGSNARKPIGSSKPKDPLADLFGGGEAEEGEAKGELGW